MTGLLVAERDVAGVIRCQRQRNAAPLGRHRIDRIGLRLDGEITDIAGASDPGVELLELADGLVLAAIDRRFSRSFGAGGGKRDRGAFEARGFVLPVSLSWCAPSPPCGGGRGGRGASTREEVPTPIALPPNPLPALADPLPTPPRPNHPAPTLSPH